MEKVDRMITAKNNEKKLTGKREAFAAIILRLVAEEQRLPIKMTDIMNCQTDHDPLQGSDIKNANKKLQKVFPEWFRTKDNDPEEIIKKKIDELKWPNELRFDALHIVQKCKSELEGSHAITIVGVALYWLNLCIQDDKQKRFEEHCKSENDLQEIIQRGLNNIKEKFERVKDKKQYVLPDKWLTEAERVSREKRLG